MEQESKRVINTKTYYTNNNKRLITTSLPIKNKGGVQVHCKCCPNYKYSSAIPHNMRVKLTIPAETKPAVKPKAKRRVLCPSGNHTSSCKVSVFTTKTRLRITTCKTCVVKRIAGGGRTDTTFYNQLERNGQVVLRTVPYKL